MIQTCVVTSERWRMHVAGVASGASDGRALLAAAHQGGVDALVCATPGASGPMIARLERAGLAPQVVGSWLRGAMPGDAAAPPGVALRHREGWDVTDDAERALRREGDVDRWGWEAAVAVGRGGWEPVTWSAERQGTLAATARAWQGDGAWEVGPIAARSAADAADLALAIAAQAPPGARVELVVPTADLGQQAGLMAVGWRADCAEEIVHTYPWFGRSQRPAEVVALRVTADDLQRMGHASGDWNAIHFDDDAARAAGLQGRVAHGLVAVAAISRHFGTVTPGPGTMFVSYRNRFFRPLYLERSYELRLSYPIVDRERGAWLAVAQVVDSDGALCLLSYNDLRVAETTKN